MPFLSILLQRPKEANVKVEAVHMKENKEGDLRIAFRMFDTNNDGFIDTRELRTMIMMLGTM